MNPPVTVSSATDQDAEIQLPAAELTENARTVLARRYLKKNEAGEPIEDPEEMFWRVASVIAAEDGKYGKSDAEVRAVAEEFYALMTQRHFEPNSPTLMNAGRPLGQLSACFVLPVEDALSNGKSGIYDTLKAMAQVHQSGGGTGFGFSRIRPAGDIVKSTTGVASGPVSFMSLYDSSTEVVKQGGTRRGANMGILRVDHPDILGFIDCKQDITKITNFNISVAVTDAFMKAVENDEEYDLVNPRTGAVGKRLNAREVFDKVVMNAWKTGEPGVYYIDRANHYNPVPHLGSYEATNPCFSGGMRLATDRGLRTFAELEREVMEIAVTTDDRVQGIRAAEEGGGTAVRTRLGTTVRRAVPVFQTRKNTEVMRLVTRHGFEVVATPDHRFFTPDGLVELKDLEPGDRVLLQSGAGVWSKDRTLPAFTPTDKFAARVKRGEATPPMEWSAELGELLGWVTGDGWVSVETPEGRTVPNYTVGMIFGDEEKKTLLPRFRDRVREWTGLRGNLTERNGTATLYYKSSLYYFLRSFGLKEARATEKRVPESIFSAPRDAVIGFLRALFTADGTVQLFEGNNTCTVRLASSSKALLQDVQQLLLNEGIVGRIHQRRKKSRRMMPDSNRELKEYQTAAQYELILGRSSRNRFAERIGFLTDRKNELVNGWIDGRSRAAAAENFTTKVLRVEPAGREDVYCTTEPVTQSVVVNGCVATNCGEQPLLPYDVCNLGSVNVGAFVRDDLPADAPWYEKIDWKGLRKVVRRSTHFLDNVIDANRYPLEEIHDLAHRIRRIGLGIMGFADLLVRVGVPYNSEEGVEVGRRIMEFLDEESKKASEILAEERGVFPEWERSIWGPDESCARAPDGERIRPERRLRNCNVTTVAPTGTISIIAGCSSGIEPLFAVAFMRNQAGVMMPDVNEDFVKMAREQGWHSEDLMKRIAEEGHIHFPEVPDEVQRTFVTAHDITPEWHVRMQAAFQEHTDSAISKTTNFPHEATPEQVREIYELAYELDCKGVTVYRDGSRSAAPLTTGKTKKGEASRELDKALGAAEKRAVALEQELAETRARLSQLEKQAAGKEKQGRQQFKRSRPEVLSGSTRKMGSPLGDVYVTINEDQQHRPFEVFATLGKAGSVAMADIEAIGRLISLTLRFGIPISEVHAQLRGISSDKAIGFGANKVLSVPDAIAQAIELREREKAGIQQELISDLSPSAEVADGTTQLEPHPEETLGLPLGDYDASETFIGICPECQSQLEMAEGCMKCHACGFSECG